MRLFKILIFTMLFFNIGIQAQNISIIPEPAYIEVSSKTTKFSRETGLNIKNSTANSVSYLTTRLKEGLNLVLSECNNCKSTLSLVLDTTYSKNKEAYSLIIDNDIEIRASDDAGLFYGVQSFLQLLPPEVYGNNRISKDSYELPQLIIKDEPRFAWRGHMLDIARHFFDKDEIMKTIDVMATHKLNVLHLHLSDFDAWRVEIKKYPELINVGSRGHHTSWAKGKARYYLSQNEIKEIIAYAQTRHVMIIPEIDMPGHSTAAARSYPEYFDGHASYNPAKEETFVFISDILDELMAIFPAPYFHIGGDEVSRQARWEGRKDIQELMNKKGFTTIDDVQNYFDIRVVDMVLAKGKTPIGWNEMAYFDVDPKTQFQWWQGDFDTPHGQKALARNHKIVMSPSGKMYLDYPQQFNEPGWGTEANSVEEIYEWEPVPSTLTNEQEKNIIGIEAPLWTEWVESNEYRQFMTYPRLAGVAEVAWSQKGNKNLEGFKNRMEYQYKRYNALGVNYRAPGINSGNKYKAH
nr:beta-N-acetylhexosaminidase [uncultured Marinifilum sp.]